jgi:hypothetical protein
MDDVLKELALNVDVNGAMAMLESIFTDHIDIEAEEAKIRDRQEAREPRVSEFLSALNGDSYTEDEMTRLMIESGLMDGVIEAQLKLQTLALIRKFRQRRN